MESKMIHFSGTILGLFDFATQVHREEVSFKGEFDCKKKTGSLKIDTQSLTIIGFREIRSGQYSFQVSSNANNLNISGSLLMNVGNHSTSRIGEYHFNSRKQGGRDFSCSGKIIRCQVENRQS